MTVKTDRLVTLFGGGGFIGRYVAQALFKAGVRVRIAEREPRRAFFLRPLVRPRPDPVRSRRHRRRENDVAAAVAGADAVINLVGILKGNFHAVHVDGAAQRRRSGRGSRAPAPSSTSRRSAPIPKAQSDYGRSKGEGEAAVRAAFPGATIIRPSIVFGPEDNFVNRFASMARLLPVAAGDPRRVEGCSRSTPPTSARRSRAAALEPARSCRQDLRAGRTAGAARCASSTTGSAGRSATIRAGGRSPRCLRPADGAAVRLGAGRADHLGPVADAADGQCRERRAARLRGLRSPPGAAGGGGRSLASHLSPPWPLGILVARLTLSVSDALTAAGPSAKGAPSLYGGFQRTGGRVVKGSRL